MAEYNTARASTDWMEREILMSAIYEGSGYDFRNYSSPFIDRKVNKFITQFHLENTEQIVNFLRASEKNCKALLNICTVNYSELFRDPTFFSAIRMKVLPFLATYSTIKIWHAGCASGEEVYSMAILLHELGLLSNCTIYATDINGDVLEQAKRGTFSSQQIQSVTKNYFQAGGQRSFSEYYTCSRGQVQFRDFLKENIRFSVHDLIRDEAPDQCHLILCRNVLIYFNQKLQERVVSHLSASVSHLGYLGLGQKESLRLNNASIGLACIDKNERIFRKVMSKN